MKWQAYHFFIHTYEIQDIFLRDYLDETIHMLKDCGRIKQFFFIRYWQGGPHIRLRFKKADPQDLGVEEAILQCFEDFNKDQPNHINLESEQYYQNHTFDGVPVPANELYWFSSGSVVEKPYEPEYERYGGEAVMAYSETLFEVSSELVLSLLRNPKMTFGKKMIMGLDLYQIASSLTDHPDNFHRIYSHMWTSHKSAHLNYSKLVYDYLEVYYHRRTQLMESIESTPYSHWHFSLMEALDQIVAEQTVYPNPGATRMSLIASHIHMTNNRLGVSPQFEYLLSEVSAVMREGRIG